MTKFNFDIIFYGGPGAGKGTQAEMLRDRISALHLNMGAELRALAGQETSEAKALREIMNDGKLVPDSISATLARNFVASANGESIIFDGYPRSVEQAQDLDAILKEFNRVGKMVYLELPSAVALERITKRAHIEHRADDMDSEAVKERIEIFNDNAKELIKYYSQDNRLINVNGEGDIEEISKRVFEAIQNAAD